jgi:hypothetical protein
LLSWYIDCHRVKTLDLFLQTWGLEQNYRIILPQGIAYLRLRFQNRFVRDCRITFAITALQEFKFIEVLNDESLCFRNVTLCFVRIKPHKILLHD